MTLSRFPLRASLVAGLFALAASAGAAAKETLLSQLMIMGIDGTGACVVYQTPQHLEAPNWTPDGRWLIYNSGGRLYRLSVAGGAPEVVPTGRVRNINNDHVLSPDGARIYFSAGGNLYVVPVSGGEPRRISNAQLPERKFVAYLHGISPDEKTVAYVGVEAKRSATLYTLPVAGGADKLLLDVKGPSDGPEYASDGRWIYFNSERDADMPGHSQCYRMKPDGSGIEQLTHDARVNWFPHPSPDRKWVVYISFPPGAVGHPPNKAVILRRMRPDGSAPRDLLAFNGGQGTINVNSWSPDSRHFAFVRYVPAGP